MIRIYFKALKDYLIKRRPFVPKRAVAMFRSRLKHTVRLQFLHSKALREFIK
jgi:hypothetical protein